TVAGPLQGSDAISRARACTRSAWAEAATLRPVAEAIELRLDLGSDSAAGPALEIQPIGAASLVRPPGDPQQASEVEAGRAGLARARVPANEQRVGRHGFVALAGGELLLGQARERSRGGRGRPVELVGIA